MDNKTKLPEKIQSFSHLPHRRWQDATSIAQPLYSPRWRWSPPVAFAPPVIGGAPQAHPLDILGVLDPPGTAASPLCAFPNAFIDAIEHATQTFGAPPFAVLLAVLAAYEADLPEEARLNPAAAPILVGSFGPGAAAARRAAMAVYPKASRHIVELYAVRGAPGQSDDDPLRMGIWPILCPAYLPKSLSTPPPTVRPFTPTDLRSASSARWATGRATCNQRQLLASICGDDAESTFLPPDARHWITALPRLMDRLGFVLTVLTSSGDHLRMVKHFDPSAKFRVLDEMAETACELALVARIHLIAFYARIRPAPTGRVHRAAAALLRHRQKSVSPTTLTSAITDADLRDLVAAGWLDPNEDDAPGGGRHGYAPTDALQRIGAAELPRKRPSRPQPICVVSDCAY
ncbi:hypothetical protein AB4874_18235 [Thioclava sp. 15-R06ZXC-3]|uniref:DUF3987 domain-containing protein n=1 Tax=Thioclava arctica TaxID=3238301 RepID=A0ABV3TPN1_9RHOB